LPREAVIPYINGFKPCEVSYHGWNDAQQAIYAENKNLKTTQLSEIGWDGAGESRASEVEDSEEREVTKMR
jgi:hypothetical protein